MKFTAESKLRKGGDGGEILKHGTGRLLLQKEVPISLGLTDEVQHVKSYVVKHQGEQRLVRAEFHLKNARNGAIKTCHQHSRKTHQNQCQPHGEDGAEAEHHEGGGNGAHDKLALTADVPEAHLEGKRQGGCRQRQRNKFLKIVHKGLVGDSVAHGTHGEHLIVIFNGIHSHEQ